jgi:hypothetical protein
MGLDEPLPGSLVFHSTWVASHFSGYLPIPVLPFESGPRQLGQSPAPAAAMTVHEANKTARVPILGRARPDIAKNRMLSIKLDSG